MNADLFRAADLSFSVEGLPLNQPLSSLPVASASRFSAIDSAFNSSIVGLHTALPLGDVVGTQEAAHWVVGWWSWFPLRAASLFCSPVTPTDLVLLGAHVALVKWLPLGNALAPRVAFAAQPYGAFELAASRFSVGCVSFGVVGAAKWHMTRKVRRGGAIVGLDDVGSIIIDLIREGRRLLTNTYQASVQFGRFLLILKICFYLTSVHMQKSFHGGWLLV